MEQGFLVNQHTAVKSILHQCVLEHDLIGFVLEMYQIDLMQIREPIICRVAATARSTSRVDRLPIVAAA
jgi:hypothetical protein